MYASVKGYTEIVQMLLEQEGIDRNTKDACLFYGMYNIITWEFFAKFGVS